MASAMLLNRQVEGQSLEHMSNQTLGLPGSTHQTVAL